MANDDHATAAARDDPPTPTPARRMIRPSRHRKPLGFGLVALVLAAMLSLPSLSGGIPASDGLAVHFDAAEGRTPMDLAGVRFGQTASTDLTLIVRTERPFDSSMVNPRFGRSLCILLRSDEQAHPAGRLCAYPSQNARSGLSLRYTVLDQRGKQIGIRDLAPVVSRPDEQTFRVSFPPALLRLKPGLYHWKARSQYRDDASCPPPGGCEDLLPDGGELDLHVTLAVAPAARQRCFGAASRDVRRPCRNPRLAREVVPTPDAAVITPNLPCAPLQPVGFIIPCEFGVPAEAARSTVALIGDSHAAHWRSALEIVAQAQRWHGVSITRSGCPLTRATPRLDPAPRRARCGRWNAEVPAWLAQHPQVSTVFVVAHFDAAVVVKNRAHEFAAKAAGYVRAWKALPRSVKRIIVIRDTPKSQPDTLNCVRAAIAKRKRPGVVCALARASVLSPDAAAVAASHQHSPRIKMIDMTSFFCNAQLCFPVVGGALVYKDISHLTDVYTSSLGPFLLRKIRALSGG
jgi:hypothetical protein